jgi:radical SAM protein (TIGR01212 family)
MKKTQKSQNPFPFSDTNKRYYTMDYYMRSVFGKKACKIPINAGFSCPNRDGNKGYGGCAFCGESGGGDFATATQDSLISKASSKKTCSITEQINTGAEIMRKKWKDAVLIPYFQAYTNTYAPVSVLKEKYCEALSHPLCTGICIATRPDCITPEVSELLHEIAKEHFLMLELGLQTAHDKTAESFNRCYCFDDFLNAYELMKDLFVCVHLINGLPGETHDMMLESAKILARLSPKAVKIHSLYVIKGTKTEEDYLSGNFKTLTLNEYVNTVCDQLELFPQSTVIERVTGDGLKDSLVAPEWSKKKLVVQNEIDKELFRRGSYQGIKYTP